MKNLLKDGIIKAKWGPRKNPLAATVVAVFGFGLILLTIAGNISGYQRIPKDTLSVSSWQGMSIAQGAKDVEQYKDAFWAVARGQLVGTPMEDTEGYFYELKDLGIDPVFGLAVARHESQYAKIYVDRQLNHSVFDKNGFGIMIQSGPYNLRRFGSYRDSILSHYGFGGVISRIYLAKGLTTIKKIAPVYCVDGGRHGAWGDKVEEIYEDLWKQIRQA